MIGLAPAIANAIFDATEGSPAIPAVGTAGLEDVRLIAAVSTSYGVHAISRTILESLSL